MAEANLEGATSPKLATLVSNTGIYPGPRAGHSLTPVSLSVDGRGSCDFIVLFGGQQAIGTGQLLKWLHALLDIFFLLACNSHLFKRA